jgi:Ricin-type beta-trefoil lectin domain/PASTA domain/Putative Ig domain
MDHPPNRRRRRPTWRLLISAALLTGGLTVVTATPAQALSQPTGLFVGIQGKCVTYGEYVKSPLPTGAPITLATCNDAVPQYWQSGNASFDHQLMPATALFDLDSASCLDVNGTTVGSPVVVNRCSTATSQKWDTTTPGGPGEIVDEALHLCLQPAGGNSADGTPLVVGACTGATYQWFNKWEEPYKLVVPGSQLSGRGVPASLPLQETNGFPPELPLVWGATGLPPGLTIDSRRGQPNGATVTSTISGTPTAYGTYTVSFFITTPSGDAIAAFFQWTIAASVPNVLGLDKSTATTTLANAGFVVNSRTVNDCVSPGDVDLQSPASGSVLSPGSTVMITISACPPPPSGGGGGINPK